LDGYLPIEYFIVNRMTYYLINWRCGKMKDVITTFPLFSKTLSKKLPLLTGLVVFLSVLLAAGLGGPLRAAAAGSPVEYVVNGGFETGDFSDWSVTLMDQSRKSPPNRKNPRNRLRRSCPEPGEPCLLGNCWPWA
jgi:hypothetical protein